MGTSRQQNSPGCFLQCRNTKCNYGVGVPKFETTSLFESYLQMLLGDRQKERERESFIGAS